jgi:hypothetical protein
MEGPDSWSGRPRELRPIRVSTLSKELRKLFKKYIGKRRWTTEYEIQRLLDTKRIRFFSDVKDTKNEN